jgi:hypothetical protein
VRLFLLSIGLLFVVAAESACGGEKLTGPDQAQQKQSNSGPVTDYPSLIDKLRAAGVSVDPAGEVEQPFLSVTGKMIKLYGEDVQVFQYSSAAQMEAQAALISRDGTGVGTRKIHWIGSPHFYKQGRVLVLYVGQDTKVEKALEAVLGRQFAGQ